MLSAARRFLSTPGARAFAARGAAVATAAAGVGAFSAQCDSIKLNVTIPVEVDVDQHGQLTTSWSSTDVDELVAAQHGHVAPWQCPASAPAPPQGALGGSGQLGAPSASEPTATADPTTFDHPGGGESRAARSRPEEGQGWHGGLAQHSAPRVSTLPCAHPDK